MKPILKLMIGTLLLSGLASCATSPRERVISDASEEATIMSGELEAQFTSDHLTEDRLSALEQRAQQKLLDFADYVSLLSDSSLDSTFLTQAEEQARQLFMPPEARIVLAEEDFLISDFFREIQQSKDAFPYVVQNIRVTKSLQPSSSEQYAGKISFSQPVTVNGREITYEREAEIRVKKVDKQFGSEQKKVWEVFLGTIE